MVLAVAAVVVVVVVVVLVVVLVAVLVVVVLVVAVVQIIAIGIIGESWAVVLLIWVKVGELIVFCGNAKRTRSSHASSRHGRSPIRITIANTQAV